MTFSDKRLSDAESKSIILVDPPKLKVVYEGKFVMVSKDDGHFEMEMPVESLKGSEKDENTY